MVYRERSMTGTPSPISDVPEEFARRRRRQIMVTIPTFVVGFVAFVLGSRDQEPSVGYLAIFGVAFVSLLVFSLINWRCPSCNGYLRKATNPKFCPNCGVALRQPSA